MTNLTSLDLREAIRQKYVWPGGYEIYFVTSDGAALCFDCARKEYRQVAWSRRFKVNNGWRIEAMDCTANTDSEITCDHCNKTIQEE